MANSPVGGSSVSQATRFAHLETQVGNVAVQLGNFIKDSKEYRERTERDQAQIWGAIKDQGEQFRGAVEKLSGRGQISWPMIVATVGMVLSVSAAAAGVGHLLMESRMKQLEIRDHFLEKAVDENHSAIREMEKGQKKN